MGAFVHFKNMKKTRLALLVPVCISAVAVLLMQGCATSSPSTSAARATADDENFPIIDAHTHNHFKGVPERTSKIMDTPEEYLKEMKESNIVGAVVHTGENQEDYHPELKQYNVIYCAGSGAHPNVKNIENGLKEGKYSCIKIYLGYVHQWAYDKNYEPLYKLAEKYNVPVVYHTGDTYSVKGKLKYADPLTIDEVAVDHPNVKFVIAHCGNPWIESAAEVAYKNPNVYLDGSAFMIGDLTKYSPEIINEYVTKPLAWIFGYVDDPTKLMYGTDWPLTDMKGYLAAFKRAIPKKYWRDVFYNNATRVFKFPKSPPVPLEN